MQRVRTFSQFARRFFCGQQSGHARQRAVLLALYVSLICWLEQTQAAAPSPDYAQQQQLASMPSPVLLLSLARVFANTGLGWHLNQEAK